MAALFVGIDLGGSGTRAVLADASGEILAFGRGPTGLLGGGAAANRQLARALDAALASIEARVGDAASSVFAGTRGLSIPGRRERLELELTTRFRGARVQVSNDAHIGLWGGLAGQPGVAVIAGAGSIALARRADGAQGRAGGWGYLLGDEGSGYWIGREALLHYLRCLERREPAGSLADRVAAAAGQSDVVKVLTWFYAGHGQVERLAALAPLVSEAARGGDPQAVTILERAGQALADLAAAAAQQLWGATPPPGVAVVTAGGLWAAGPSLEAAFAARLSAVVPGAHRKPPRLPPVGGALLLAMGAEASALDPAVLNQVEAGFARVL
jgi:N-acetylglucosamine kinase-like BadF-type ATPase